MGGCKQLPAVNKEIQRGYLYIFSISFPKATVERGIKSGELCFGEIGRVGMPPCDHFFRRLRSHEMRVAGLHSIFMYSKV